MKLGRWWKAWIVVAVAGVAVAYGAASRAREAFVRVDRGEIERRVIARAVVAPVDGVSEVRPQLDARVVRVWVAEGDRVEAGQLLAELDGTKYELAVARARAEVGVQEAITHGLRRGGRPEAQLELLALQRSAESELTLAEDQAKRASHLKESGAIAETSEQQTTVAAEVARARVEALRARYQASQSGATDDVRAAVYRLESAGAELRIAEEDLARARIVAPVSGVVLARRIDPGDFTRATDPAAVFELAEPDHLELRAEVEEKQATLVRSGARVGVAMPGQHEVLARGRVSRMGPHVGRRSISGDPSELRADSLVRDVFVALDADAALALPLGERVETTIEVEPRIAAARVPREAVAIREGRAMVEVARGLLREPRPVQLFAADDRYVEVRGVDPGTELVVISPTEGGGRTP